MRACVRVLLSSSSQLSAQTTIAYAYFKTVGGHQRNRSIFLPCLLTFLDRFLCLLQLQLFVSKLTGSAIGFTAVGIITVTKETVLTVSLPVGS